jgi:serine/threonine-protein kinase RsbW
MNRQVQRVTIFPEKDHFSQCFAVVSELGRQLGFDPEEEFRFAVCVSEAYTNAFVHGNKQDPSKSIDLVFTWDDVSVRVDVEDQGNAQIQDVRIDDSRPDVDSEKTGGRGVGIMKLFADKMEVEERPEGGLRVSITFRLRENRATSDVLLHNSNGGFHGNQSH